MSEQRVSHRRTHRLRVILFLAVLTAATSALSQAALAAPKDPVLAIADYAFVTASHSRPVRAVTAADLLNAEETKTTSNSNLFLSANIGAIFGYPRLAVFSNSTMFTQTCVIFPAEVGHKPFEIKCPTRAIVLWQEQPTVLTESREAVAFAETRGTAVSGSDIGPFFDGSNVHVVGNPTFKPGQGGTVRFAIKLKINGTTASGDICVRFPRTEAGIPVQVDC
jgi:hypothetical protein